MGGPCSLQPSSLPGNGHRNVARSSTRTQASNAFNSAHLLCNRRSFGPSSDPPCLSSAAGFHQRGPCRSHQQTGWHHREAAASQSSRSDSSERQRSAPRERQIPVCSAVELSQVEVTARADPPTSADAAPAADEAQGNQHTNSLHRISAVEVSSVGAPGREVLHHIHEPSRLKRPQQEGGNIPAPAHDPALISSTLSPAASSSTSASDPLATPDSLPSAATREDAPDAEEDSDQQPSESGYLSAAQLAAAREAEGAAAAQPAAVWPSSRWPRLRTGKDPAGSSRKALEEQPTESGVVPEDQLSTARIQVADGTLAPAPESALLPAGNRIALFQPREQSQIRESWRKIMRWSRDFKGRGERSGTLSVLERTHKVVVFGGGSFGTAVGTALARQKSDLAVSLLLRDPYVCKSINDTHRNLRYLAEYEMPPNITATTSMIEAIRDAQYAVHAVPVQHSRAFLHSIKDVLPAHVPIICVSKGLEVGTGKMMSELIPGALGRRQPAVFLSGPSFAKEVMDLCPTGVVAACKDAKLAREVQELLAGPYMRVNTTSDVIGVEICGALKNVLAIAAGIVEGLDLGNNAMAALLTQGCSEIRWLAEKMGAKPATVSGLSGLGDIMLTCYGTLSRNRSVGVRLGRGEALQDIMASSLQVAEGVTTAGVVVGLGLRYRVSLPVLTAVAQVLDGNLSPREAVWEIMNLPQIEEK